MTRSVLAALVVLLIAAAPSGASGVGSAQDPVLASYIVVLKPDAARSAAAAPSARPLVATVAQELSRAHDGAVTSVYQYALKGFAARLSAGQAAALTNDPRVAYVEQDQEFHTLATQTPATWGLDRIDQRDLPLNNTYNYNQTGQGVHAYIIDTGVRATHQQFTGRMGNGFTAINDGNGTNDCNGHGTHVAGTTGGTTYGVAKQVTLHAVRVLSCSGSGSNAGVIAGVDWVTANSVKPAVANMSLGGGVSSALDSAVNNSIASGVSYAIAAGNSNANACNSSPARVANAVTVGSTTNTDARSSFSNFGTCVDIFAPGSSITSAWSTSDTATNTISGTSMATPHVAGALALYLQTNPGASASTAAGALIANSTPNKVTNPGSGSPNRLLYSIFGGGGGGDTTPPTTSITSPANGATVSGTVTVSANASDNVGVSRVELYVDGALAGTDTSSPYQIAWNTTATSNGPHTLQTRAYDAAGNNGSSVSVGVTVNNGGGRRWRADRQRRVRGIGSVVVALRQRLLVERWKPALGDRLHRAGLLQQRQRHRVSDRDDPGGSPRESHVLAPDHDQRVPVHRLRLPLRRGAEHVGCASGHADHLQQPQCERVLAEVLQPRRLARSDGAGPVQGNDRQQPDDVLPGRRRLAEVALVK